MLAKICPSLNIEKILPEILSSDWSNVDYIRLFEEKFAEKISARKAFATDQGRTALLLALEILNIKKGDEVIVQPYVRKSIIDTIISIGAVPVLVSKSSKDFDVAHIDMERKITQRTKAIIGTHLFGIPCDVSKLARVAKRNRLYLIEDCTQCLGARLKGRDVGTFGDFSIFSFSFNKPVSIGRGGMLIVNNRKFLTRAKRIVNQSVRISLDSEKKILYSLILQYLLVQRDIYRGKLSLDVAETILRDLGGLTRLFDKLFEKDADRKKILSDIISLIRKYQLSGEGLYFSAKLHNKIKSLLFWIRSRVEVKKKKLLMNSLRALVGLVQLETLEAVNKKRSKNVAYFRPLLDPDKFSMIEASSQKAPAYLEFPILNNTEHESIKISRICKKKGFEIGIWSLSDHWSFFYYFLVSADKEYLKNCKYLSKKLLFVPVHHLVTERDMKDMAKILNSF